MEAEVAGAATGAEPKPSRGRLRTADFDYELPVDLIAQRPAARRDESRLLVLHRRTGEIEDRAFGDLVEFFAPGDALVLNDSRVFPARLRGRKPTGAPAEILLLRPFAGDAEGRVWEALVRPGGKLKPGRIVDVAPDFRVRVDDSIPGGGRRVTLLGDGSPWELIDRHGQIPLPPYITRADDERDRERYQTVYARQPGSVAAPTAGLHFTRRLLRTIRSQGVRTVRLTLHVGVGTFRPVEAEIPEDHQLHEEQYELPVTAARILSRVRGAGGRVWAVGTTSARALEASVGADGAIRSGRGWTSLFIHPPYTFRAVDVLLTNFHLPCSTLLMLVAAFAGLERVLDAYAHAARERYRFYSYGDAMLIL